MESCKKSIDFFGAQELYWGQRGGICMIGIIITGVLCVVCLILSVILLSGNGAWLIAGYNTAPYEEKEKYDDEKMSRAAGVLMLFAAVLAAGLGAAGYFAEIGKMQEKFMMIPAAVFILLLFAGIVILSVYINKKCKKQCKSIKKRKGDLNAFPLFLILCIYTISKPIR